MAISKPHWPMIVWISILTFGLMASGVAAGDRTEDLLKELSQAAGPQGFEEPVRTIMVREMKPLVRRLDVP